MENPYAILADEIVRAFDDRDTATAYEPVTLANGDVDRDSRRVHYVRFPAVRGLPAGVALVEVDAMDRARIEDVTVLWDPHYPRSPEAPSVAAAEVEILVEAALANHSAL